jgi:hypothetical protein
VGVTVSLTSCSKQLWVARIMRAVWGMCTSQGGPVERSQRESYVSRMGSLRDRSTSKPYFRRAACIRGTAGGWLPRILPAMSRWISRGALTLTRQLPNPRL